MVSQRDREQGSDPLAPVRAAVAGGEWEHALALLGRLGPEHAHGAEALEMRAQAAYGNGELEACISAWEELHARSLEDGDPAGAARAAAMIAMYLMMDTGLMAPVRGWLRRAERLLADGAAGTPAEALVPMVRSYERFMSGDMDAVREQSLLAIEQGERLGVTAAVVIGRVAAARVRILDGDVAGGWEQLDEVGTLLMAGDADPLTTGMMYCELICAAQSLALYDRASEWTDVMDRWRHSAAVGGINGRCRVHRAELLRVSGPCDAAEEEALRACEELRPWMRREFGWPLVELGTIRLRKGDLEGAEEAFQHAYQHAWTPQPGMALLRLEQGDVHAATELIAEAIAHPSTVPSKELPPSGELRLAPLWEAQARIAEAAGDADTARRAADALGAVAATYPTRSLLASAALAEGRAALVAGDHDAAIDQCGRAVAEFSDLGAPFEAAVARTVLARAWAASGRPSLAHEETETARRAFSDFGARRWAERTGLPPTASTQVAPPAGGAVTRAEFTCRGDTRTVDFAGETVHLHDLTGLRHLARLLDAPGREFHALDLVALERGTPPDPGTVGSPDHHGLTDAAEGVGAGIPVLDDQARAAYRRRLHEIEEDIEEAVRFNDPGRVELAERDRHFLVDELTRAVGVDGRPRTLGGNAERARTSVTRSIRYALRRLDQHHPAAAAHLRQCVRTGTYCAYDPDPLTRTDWTV